MQLKWNNHSTDKMSDKTKAKSEKHETLIQGQYKALASFTTVHYMCCFKSVQGGCSSVSSELSCCFSVAGWSLWSMGRPDTLWRDRNTMWVRWLSPEGSEPASWLLPAPEPDLWPLCQEGGGGVIQWVWYQAGGRWRGFNDTQSVLCDMTSLPQSMYW